MKRLLLVVLALGVVGLLAGQVLAAAEGDRPRPSAADRLKEVYDALLKELNLTDKQDKPVRQILDTFRQEMTAWTERNAADMTKLREEMTKAREEGRADDVKAVSEKLRKLTVERVKKTENVLTQLKDVLDEKQLAKARLILEAGRFGGSARSQLLMGQLDLTETQRASVREINTAAREETQKAESLLARAEVQKKAWDKIVKEVLTDEQRAKLEKLQKELAAPASAPAGRGRAMFEGLGLTAEQQAKVNEIMEAARKKGADAGTPEARREAFQAARKEIAEKVLNEEQRKKYEERMRERRSAGGGAAGN